jgi:glycosyltransferase involved in cell wall biosynthesis
MGHGALHGQRTMQAFARLNCWRSVLLTGRGFSKRIAGLPVDGVVREIDVGLETLGGYRGPVGALVWGLRSWWMQRKLFSNVEKIISEEHIDAVLFLDGNPGVIYDCWQHCRTRFPNVGWVVAHNKIDFWLSEFSIRSVYKASIASKVRQMALNMGATILYGDSALRQEFCDKLRIDASVAQRIYMTGFGSDPEDLRIARDYARHQLKIPLDARVALFFGMIRTDKRPKIAVDAVAQAGAPWWILMAGKPHSFSESNIQGWVDAANLNARAVLLLRYLAEDEIRLVFSAADVLIAPHDNDTLANSGPLCLCRSYRLPAIIGPSGFLAKSILRDGVGLVAKGTNDTHFAEQLQRFERLEESERILLNEHLEAVAEKYSFEATVRNYQEALEHASQYANRMH